MELNESEKNLNRAADLVDKTLWTLSSHGFGDIMLLFLGDQWPLHATIQKAHMLNQEMRLNYIILF